MTANQIRMMFSGNEQNDIFPSASSIVDIGQNVKISIKMNEDSQSYYYSINVLDLAQSSIKDDILKDMIQSGWMLSKNQQEIIKIC